MSTTTSTSPTPAPTAGRGGVPRGEAVTTQPVTLPRVVRSEWIKFRTLRSSLIVLAATVAALIVFAAIIAHNTRNPAGQDANDLVASGPFQGYYLGQLLMGALGVLVVSGEYSSGMIRATLAAVPRRLPVLFAKGIVFTAVVLTTLTVACVIAFYVAQAELSGYRPTYSLSQGSTLRVVIGTAVYLTLIGLFGTAVAWIMRSTPGALIALFATILVLPILFGVLFHKWGDYVAAWLPTGAGASFSTNLPDPHSLAPWTGLGVLVAWVVLAYVVAGITLRRRDA